MVGAIAERKARGAAHDLPFVGRERGDAPCSTTPPTRTGGRPRFRPRAASATRASASRGCSSSCSSAGQSWRLLTLAADEYSSTIPYSLVRDLLGTTRRVRPRCRAAGDSATRCGVGRARRPRRAALAAAAGHRVRRRVGADPRGRRARRGVPQRPAARSTAARDRPCPRRADLVVVDDAQWIDEASAELLADVIRDVERSPPAGLPAGERRRRAAAVGDGGADVAESMRCRCDERGDCWPRVASGGRVGAARPRRARRALRRQPAVPRQPRRRRGRDLGRGRLAAVDDREPRSPSASTTSTPRDRLLLREAAVAGHGHRPGAARPRARHAPVSAAPTCGAGCRRSSPAPGPGHLRFQHGMYQRVAYEGLSFRRRREIHLALGTAARATTAPSRPCCRCTSGEPRTTPGRSGGRSPRRRGAQRAYANVEAAELYRRALASAARSPRRRRASAPSWPRRSATCSS